MDIDAIVAAVIEDTGRSDKTALITRAVKAIVLKAHSIDYFPRDRIEVTAAAPGTPGFDVLEALPTRWRKFNYIFQCDVNGLPSYGHLGMKRVDADDQFLFDTSQRNEVYYVVGSNFRMINTSLSIDYYRYAYYEYPDVALGTDETWLMENLMTAQAIIDGATYYVHKKLEHQTAARIEQLNWDEWRSVILAEALIEDI